MLAPRMDPPSPVSLTRALGLPYPAYLRVAFWRTVLMWALARLFVFSFLALGLRVGLEESLRQPVLGLPALFVWLDRRFYHELLLPANLGASELWFWAVSLSTALTLDVAAAILLRLI